MLNIKEVITKIAGIQTYSENLRVFRLKLPEGSGFSFVPGQFVMVSLPGLADANGRKIAKAYSIASSPSQTGIMELCIVGYPTGALSPKLFQKNIGDEVAVTGPYGVFQLKQPVHPGTVFMAGGTGLAPLMGMLRSLYGTGYNEKLWLFYSVGEPRLFLFKEELLGYEKNSNLRFVVSTSNHNTDWLWEKGRVTDTFPRLLQQLQQDGVPNEERQFYICGPPLMVTDTVKMLEQLGFRKENIHKEQW
ncbi:FAD-dependent oxidoreductase [Candidatus Woesearchaeota archaeon]|nr:FAD-dependent oxidoreductase [Candidatus Woesearchaeota archaeon]